MRLAFLGSPAAAVPALVALVDAGHEIAVVVTRPDRRRGRGSATAATPVKTAALDRGLTVSHDQRDVLGVTPDLGVVVAYGAMIPSSTLDRVAMVNVHFSLLPRWRGAAPVERAILAGDETTGVCVMGLEPTLDTGPVYARAATPVARKRADELTDELSALGAELLVTTLSFGTLPVAVPQVGEPTYAHKLTSEDFELRRDASVTQLDRVVRVGRAVTFIGNRRLKVHAAAPREREPTDGNVGDVVVDDRGVQLIGVDGVLRVDVVQPDGARPMPAAAWWAGARLDAATTWGRTRDPQP